ncbi:H-type lectin domain-containing protein [Plastorhodobacter daqingensis]|uniref:H-type lectin domain-containing protein n=1 Tax=Plastorhodobacter daqingensis TaxID=1387281 RepID=A0ABW2UKV2_9RHOB
MKRFSTNRVGVDQGSLMMFSHYDSGGVMWTAKGAREVRRIITFAEPFLAPPAVHVGMTLWDIDQSTNPRADLTADKVSESGFELVFRTWADTRIARIRADWMAIGALRDDDMWDVD